MKAWKIILLKFYDFLLILYFQRFSFILQFQTIELNWSSNSLRCIMNQNIQFFHILLHISNHSLNLPFINKITLQNDQPVTPLLIPLLFFVPGNSIIRKSSSGINHSPIPQQLHHSFKTDLDPSPCDQSSQSFEVGWLVPFLEVGLGTLWAMKGVNWSWRGRGENSANVTVEGFWCLGSLWMLLFYLWLVFLVIWILWRYLWGIKPILLMTKLIKRACRSWNILRHIGLWLTFHFQLIHYFSLFFTFFTNFLPHFFLLFIFPFFTHKKLTHLFKKSLHSFILLFYFIQPLLGDPFNFSNKLNNLLDFFFHNKFIIWLILILILFFLSLTVLLFEFVCFLFHWYLYLIKKL